MNQSKSYDAEFNQWITKKFNVYNGLFLNLPFRNIGKYGNLIPVMGEAAREGLARGNSPVEILDRFFDAHTRMDKEEERIGLMFKVIQYVERQIVLYDSIEDAAFSHLSNPEDKMSLTDMIQLGNRKELESTIWDKLSTFSIRIVFTAHPTQFYPPSVLDILERLKALVDRNDLNGIDLTLQQLAMTSLMNSKKPTPLEEAGNILYFLRNIYYDALGELYSGIRKLVPAREFNHPGLVRLGFWPGGDRDGNPFVTAEITMQVVDELRMSLMKCYYRDIKELEKKLTFRDVEPIIHALREAVYTAMFDSSLSLDYGDILNPLKNAWMLVRDKYNGLYLEDLEKLIDKVKIFRTHFATLDIRQDHHVHYRAVEELLRKSGRIINKLEELQKDELTSILLSSELNAVPEEFKDEIVRETLINIRQLKAIQAKNGEMGCNRYIISNSEDVFSVLFVFALFRWCGWKQEEISFDIVPLFETMHGMSEARKVMKDLFSLDAYREHLRRRGEQQDIMLGFSDGTKDGGYLKANWSIFKTKEELSDLGHEEGVRVVFFDGRGGPPARGGGKTHRFYAAQGKRIANHEIQLTVQGQTITSRYGTKEQFAHNCEQLLTAGISRSLPGEQDDIAPEQRALIEELSELSFEKYQALKNHEKFLPYLENRSTLKYYSQANIGSRPAKRGGDRKLALSDLRAISFVGSWSQLKQNVPGYFGLGTALKILESKGEMNRLRMLFQEVPYFKALILNSMMSLSKCNFNLTNYLAKDPEYMDFWKILHNEYLLSVEMVLKISGYDGLMEEEPITRKSIEIREQIVLPLLVIQQYALQKVEEGNGMKEVYEKIIMRSLYGNINASRNSA